MVATAQKSKDEPVAGVIGIEEVTSKSQQLASIFRHPVLIDGVIFVHPRLGLRRFKTCDIRCDADLPTAKLPRDMHHLGQVVERMAAASHQE